MKIFISFLFLSLGVSVSWALEPGTSGADLLKIPLGVRPTAMAGAYAAFGDDVEVLGYNPAGLARVTKYSIGLDHIEGFAGIQIESLSAAIPTKDYGNLGGQIIFRHMPDINNELATDAPLSAFDLVITIADAHQFGKLSVGGALKTVLVKLGDKQAITEALDFGLKFQFHEVDFAVVVQNLGPALQFQGSSVTDPLPLTFRLGAARPIIVSPSATLLASVEGSHVSDEGFQGAVGLEYWHRSLLALRAGYRLTEDQSLNKGFSVGAALRHHLGRLEYEIGYAWRPSTFSSAFTANSHVFGLLFWY